MKRTNILATQPFPNHFYILSLLLWSKLRFAYNLVCTLTITIISLNDKSIRKHIKIYILFPDFVTQKTRIL